MKAEQARELQRNYDVLLLKYNTLLSKYLADQNHEGKREETVNVDLKNMYGIDMTASPLGKKTDEKSTVDYTDPQTLGRLVVSTNMINALLKDKPLRGAVSAKDFTRESMTHILLNAMDDNPDIETAITELLLYAKQQAMDMYLDRIKSKIHNEIEREMKKNALSMGD